MHAIIRIEQSRTFAMDGTSIVKQPKTAAGRRTIAVPKQLMTAVVEHLDKFTDVGDRKSVV